MLDKPAVLSSRGAMLRMPVLRLLMCVLLCASVSLIVGFASGCTNTEPGEQLADEPAATDSTTPGSSGTASGAAGGSSSSIASAASEEIPGENYLTAAELNDLLQGGSGISVFDARLYSRFALGHIPNAKWTPYKTLTERLYSIPHDEQFVIVFLNDKEAQGGWKILLDNGYDPTRIRVLKNGMDDWLRDGYEIVVEDQLGC